MGDTRSRGGAPNGVRNDNLIMFVLMIFTLIEMLELTNEWLLCLLGSVLKSQEVSSILEYFILSLHRNL